MTSEQNHLVICNSEGLPLGEMIFEGDLFLQATLQPQGESVLGGWLEDWQVHGIQYFHPDVDLSSSIGTTGEYVSMHDPVFPVALRQWLEKQSLFSVLLSESSWEIWNLIQQLPLLPDEQFRLGMRLTSLNNKEQTNYLKSLNKMLTELVDQKKAKKTSKQPAKKKKK